MGVLKCLLKYNLTILVLTSAHHTQSLLGGNAQSHICSPIQKFWIAPKTDGWFGFELTKNILVKAPNGSMSILFVSFQRKEILSVSYSFQPKHTQLGYKMKINFEKCFL